MNPFNLGFLEYDVDFQFGQVYLKGNFLCMTKENQLEALSNWIAELQEISEQIEQTSTTEEIKE